MCLPLFYPFSTPPPIQYILTQGKVQPGRPPRLTAAPNLVGSPALVLPAPPLLAHTGLITPMRVQRHIFSSSRHTISVCVEKSHSDPVKYFCHRGWHDTAANLLTMQTLCDNSIKDIVSLKNTLNRIFRHLVTKVSVEILIINVFAKLLGKLSNSYWVILDEAWVLTNQPS